MPSSSRIVHIAPWVLLGLILAAVTISLVVRDLNGGSPAGESFAEEGMLMAAFMAFPVVGALIASRQPRNSIGWLFLGIGLLVSLGVAGDEWARYSFVTRRETLPLATFGAWIASWFWVPLIGSIPTLLLLLFPTGRLPGPHPIWRLTLWGTAILIGGLAVLIGLEERLDLQGLSVPNPIGIAGLDHVEQNIPFLVLAPPVIISAASLIYRFVRAQGDERQQLKWVMFAGTILTVGVVLGDYLNLPDAVFPIVLIGFPASIAIAVLKYRLYDISVVINKTLVYAALTAVLGAIYLGIVFVLRAALPLGEQSEVTVAASTLAVAALFRPLRRWLQDLIDHLFYRRKYDAEQTVVTFSARLRDQVDLDTLTEDLLEVVDDTMSPAHASLWLRRTEEGRGT